MNAVDFTARAESLLDRVVPAMVPLLPDDIDETYFTGFMRRNRRQLVQMLAAVLRQRLAPTVSLSAPAAPDEHRRAQRAEANLAAMQIVARTRPGTRLAEADLAALRRYSGWGGIGLESYKGRFPAGLAVDPQALIHEYYTPTAVADAVAGQVAALMPSLPVDAGGKVAALEPSAGIGRYILPAPRSLVWDACEFSEVSAGILRLLRPDVRLHVGTFESWVASNNARRFGLVVANPPYGARGASFVDDPDRSTHKIKDAYIYFLMRSAGLLAPGGVGIYLIPRGFMDGSSAPLQKAREQMLRSHHLMVSFRLPSNDPSRGAEGNLFPGANVVVDVVFLRARPGVLREVDAADAAIVAGGYYKQNPGHILGKEVIEQGATGRRARFGGYEIHGRFDGFPEWTERPLCEACVISAPARAGSASSAPAPDIGEDESLGAARQLGDRVEGYLKALTADPQAAIGLHADLVAALAGWVDAYGPPKASQAILQASRDEKVRRFMEALPNGKVSIPRPPAPPAPPYRLVPTDIADWLYRQQGALTVAQVHAEHRRLGGPLPEGEVRARLYAAGWCVDGDAIMPERVYLSGHLWPRFDRAKERAASDPQAAHQLQLLRKTIRPSVLADIENIEPRQSWLPATAISAWASDTLAGYYDDPVVLEWREGLLHVAGVDYVSLANTAAERRSSGVSLSVGMLAFLGWANHDAVMFKPEKKKDQANGEDESLDQARIRQGEDWRKSFARWLAEHPDHAEAVVERYNRLFRGYVEPVREAKPLNIARWRKINLHRYQVESAQRVIAARKGLLALDVGLGKTFTALSIMATARQEGWAKRPVLYVPNSLVWKWKRDVATVLPDYRCVVIGSELYRARDGRIKSRTDSPEQRGQKWTAFRAGAFDVAIVAYTVLARTKMRPEPIEAYTRGLDSVQRAVALRRRNIQRSQQGKKPRELSERDEAILREGAKAWVAEKLQLPEGHQHDVGVWWDDIGVDMMIVDEAQNFKNLYMPEEREGGVPDYMGNPGEGSDRAWNLDFRLASVRARSGGSGVVLLSATPAKNSPLEIYNALQLIDPGIMLRAGITDPEHFIDRFCGLTRRDQEDVTGKIRTRLACTSFVNLHELRDLLYSVADYKTAAEVGLKLPEPTTHLVDVELDAGAAAAVSHAIAEIEQADEDRKEALQQGRMDSANAIGMKIMGIKMRISMLGIHGKLPGANEGGGNPEKKQAVVDTNPHSGKIDACVSRIMARKACGHIVFCDFIAAHVWLKRALVEAGMAEGRIAILNAPMVPDTEGRQRIAMDFNGTGEPGEPDYEPAKYDVVIANAVAYEGVDLQRRTCAIHHLDLPWEPATLHQRNGRGVRQGNNAANIDLFYYMALGTGDRERLDKIRGKAGWMNALNDKNARETSNPAAQLSDDGWDDFIIRHSRNPEKARARIEAKRREAEEAARARRELNVRRLLRAANDLFRRAEKAVDPAEAAMTLAEAERRLEAVLASDAVTFPWVVLASMVRSKPVYIGDTGPLLYEGLLANGTRIGKLARNQDGKLVVGVNMLTYGGDVTPIWHPQLASELERTLSFKPSDVTMGGPVPEPQRDEAIRTVMLRSGLYAMNLRLADDAWLGWWWPGIRRFMEQDRGPVLTVPFKRNGVARVAPSRYMDSDSHVYPPNAEGYAAWVADAPHNPDLAFREADDITRGWWGVGLPRDAFSRVRT